MNIEHPIAEQSRAVSQSICPLHHAYVVIIYTLHGHAMFWWFNHNGIRPFPFGIKASLLASSADQFFFKANKNVLLQKLNFNVFIQIIFLRWFFPTSFLNWFPAQSTLWFYVIHSATNISYAALKLRAFIHYSPHWNCCWFFTFNEWSQFQFGIH